MLVLSLAGALAAAVCFGLASVLETIGLRRVRPVSGVDPRLLLRALRSWPFVAGVGVDLLGFVFELAALRHLPLFLVQAAVSCSLAVTAIAAALVMRERLGRIERFAVGAVCLGLVALGLSAGPEGAVRASNRFYLVLGIGLALLGLAGVLAARLPARARTPSLGLCAGLCFGVVALSARTMPVLTPNHLLREPATYLVAAAGLLGYLLWTTALAGGAVTRATAPMVIGQTLLPAAVGVLVLGDEARAGFVPVAVVGFLLAVGGALALARFGALADPD